MATDPKTILAVPAAAAMLLWPAVWNGYPIVFADTGTYLSQAIHHYAGWDRPVFYSVFMLALHWIRTVWPVIAAQALLAAWMLWLVWRVLAPGRSTGAFLALIAFLSVGTWLPWLVSELMPDLFTPLLVLALCLLAWAPDALSRTERWSLVGLATLFIVSQQSSVPLSIGIVLLAGAAQAWRARRRVRFAGPMWSGLVIPPALAALLLCSANFVAHHRFALSPFGNVFLLARVIYDGPGREALRQDCPTRTWRLCAYRDRLPPDSDDFLWTPDSPLNLAGGPKQVAAEAGPIIRAALRIDPAGQLYASLANTWAQLRQFDSGDGLQPWPAQVSPWITEDFPPSEAAAYRSARQQAGHLAVPGWMGTVHKAGALGGTIVCLWLLVAGRTSRSMEQDDLRWRRSSRSMSLFERAIPPAGDLISTHSALSGFLLTILVTLPLSAAITGALSAPHDRYQARIMWLPPFIAVAAAARPRPR